MHHGHSRQKHCSPRSLLAEQSKIFVIHVKGVSPGSPLKVSRFSVKRGYQTLRNTRKSPIARMGSHTPGGDSGPGPAQDRNQPHSPGGCRDSRRNQWALILRAGVSPPSSGKGRRTRPRRAPMGGPHPGCACDHLPGLLRRVGRPGGERPGLKSRRLHAPMAASVPASVMESQ